MKVTVVLLVVVCVTVGVGEVLSDGGFVPVTVGVLVCVLETLTVVVRLLVTDLVLEVVGV